MSKIISDTIQGRSKDPNVNAGFTISGVTTATGVINASSDVRITGNLNAGIVTVTSISGNGAGLSNVGVDTATVDASTLQVSGISTFKNELKVTAGGIEVDGGGLDIAGVSTFASDVRVTGNLNAGITTATAFVPSSGQLSNRNLIINGAMQVAQRGTSSTTIGYQTLDRYYLDFTGTDENPTQAQVDVASGTTPYTLGFRKAYKITNGDQSGGAGTSDGIFLNYSIEAQDIANSGWNYTSASSFITLSFWVKSSVGQNFYGRLYSYDGTSQGYAFETGSLTADTWTKVTKIIAGNSNLQFDNDANAGLLLELVAFRGTAFTASMTLNQWAAYNSNSRTPDNTTTWYTTNNATLEFTGIQLEVGSAATPFEHRSFGEELNLCKRYFQPFIQYAEYVSGGTGNLGFPYTAFTVPMRASPTFVSDHESKSSNWSFHTMQVQGSDAYGYYAYAISYNTTDSNYGYMRKYGTASAEL